MAGTNSMHCYADLRVNSYIVGSGPSILTVAVEREPYLAGATPKQYEPNRRDIEKTLLEGVTDVKRSMIMAPSGGIEGREAMLLIGPAMDASIEAWQVFRTWYLERREDDTVVAVHPFRPEWKRYGRYTANRSLLELELTDFRQAVATAHQTRLTANGGRTGPDPGYPMLQTDANRLSDFYTEINAYNHPEGPPAKPPPACGLAVPGDDYNPDLMLDCRALLVAKDELRGTGTLNWDTGTLISSWDGVTTGGTPTRVTKVELDDEDLTGSIPADMGSLSELTHLDLSDNSLTGDIPRELGHLDNLEEVRLSGNTLTGCIPYGLKDVTTNDLSSLSLLYCPPAPDAPTGGIAGSTSLPLSWLAAASTTKYRVEYREGRHYGPWILDDESITATAHTVDGLLCKTEHGFRLSTYGDGTTYAAAWSDPSDPLVRTTGSCTPPVFGAEQYKFSVSDDAAIGTLVGTVSATDDSGQPVVYDIDSDEISDLDAYEDLLLDEQTGAITLSADLSGRIGESTSFIVTARNQDGGVAEVEVFIEVTKS